MLALNKHSYLGSFYGIIPSGVTPEYIPIHDRWNLAMVHRTPSVSCGPTLQSVSRPPGVNLLHPLAWITRDTTPTSWLKPYHT